jgi:hypothetical protein
MRSENCIVVVLKVTMAATVTNLKRILMAWGSRYVFIITPEPRYLSLPCYCNNAHCRHLLIPDSGMKLMCDLARLHQFISRRLFSSANCTVIPTFDLLVGNKSANPEEALAAFSSWGAVHGSNASYTRITLSLVDNHFGKSSVAAPVEPSRLTPPSTKRPRESSPAAGQPIPVLSSFRLPAPRQPSLWLHQGWDKGRQQQLQPGLPEGLSGSEWMSCN